MLHKVNGIASFFASYPQDEAIAGIANHLRMYWVPRMRMQLIEYVEAHGSTGLHALVPDAVALLEKPVIRT